ncbi:long-chain fatty acid--CoA ligase [Calidifontibacter sp. DB0510]|uniref:Long-chain fatty acid--CoA ligase n=1 Tax=Metallococcus carri TaxID=1656884 RepID=A0A967EDL8_9MICO|nr:AMP-binding protein [Metallococcus carri]NHN54856.1 long-chain fatty acid--CoA ligase [Metallococcus carri]NOP37201.1 AMP-binding protein [Calidifontibacter sp. DB2511S]
MTDLVLVPKPLPDPEGVWRDEQGVAHFSNLPASLVAMLRRRAEEHPEREAIVEVDGPRLTYGELWQRASALAGGLRDKGIRAGDRVAITHPAGADWVVSFFGAQLAGAMAVPVNIRFARDEIDYVLHDSGAAIVLGPDEEAPSGEPFAAAPSLGDPAAIFYTSGTTGHPKGALTSHEAFLSYCETAARLRPSGGPLPRTLIVVPLFHVTGCNAQLIPVLAAGGAAVILPRFDVARLLRALAEERVTSFVAVPAIYALMLAHPDFATTDLSHLMTVGYGGAPMSPELAHRVGEAFPKVLRTNGFGMTETAGLGATLPPDLADSHAGSVGYPSLVVDLALERPDADGVGELLVRSPSVTLGYWNRPEATADAFRDGWFRTGDLARMAPDGTLRLVDRAKDMIVRGGENVYCVEVENALAAVPGVRESAVIGVPNEVLGEAVGALVVPESGIPLDPAQIVTALVGRIADYKIPQYVVVRDEPLPRNPGGKILKKALRDNGIAWGERLR